MSCYFIKLFSFHCFSDILDDYEFAVFNVTFLSIEICAYVTRSKNSTCIYISLKLNTCIKVQRIPSLAWLPKQVYVLKCQKWSRVSLLYKSENMNCHKTIPCKLNLRELCNLTRLYKLCLTDINLLDNPYAT